MPPPTNQHSGLWLDWNFVKKNTKEETYVSPFDIIKWTEIREVRESGIQEMKESLSYGYNPHLAPVYVKRRSGTSTVCLCVDGMHRVEAMKYFWSLSNHPLKGTKLRVIVLADRLTERQCIAIAIMINRSNEDYVPTTLYDKICEFERIKLSLEKNSRTNFKATFTDVARAKLESHGRSDLATDKIVNECRKAVSVALRISGMEKTRRVVRSICNSTLTRNTFTFFGLAKVLGEKSLKKNDFKTSYALRALVSTARKRNGEFDRLGEDTAKLRVSRFSRAWKHIENLGEYLGESTTRTDTLLFDSDWPEEVKNAAYNFIVDVLRGGKTFSLIYGLPDDIVGAIKNTYPGYEELLDRCYRDISQNLGRKSSNMSGQRGQAPLTKHSASSCNGITGSHQDTPSPRDLSAAQAMEALASSPAETRDPPNSPKGTERTERVVKDKTTEVEPKMTHEEEKNREHEEMPKKGDGESKGKRSFEPRIEDHIDDGEKTSSEGIPPRKWLKCQQSGTQNSKNTSDHAAERHTNNLGDSSLCLNMSFQTSLAEVKHWVRSMYRTSPAVDLMIFGPPEGPSHDGPIVGYDLTEFAHALCSPGASILVITSHSATANEWQRIFCSSPYFEPERELSILVEDQRKYLHHNTERIVTTRFVAIARRTGVTLRAQRSAGIVQLDGFGQQSMKIPNRYLAVSNVISGCPPLSKAEDLSDRTRKFSIENQIPVAILKELILRYSATGDIVCDPFSGSFATAKACAITGRLFVGCERSENVFLEGFSSLEETHSDIHTHKRNVWIQKWISGSTNHPFWVREASNFAEKLRQDCLATNTRVEKSQLLDGPDEKGLFTNEIREKDDLIGYYYGRYTSEDLLNDEEKSYDFTEAELERKIKIRSIALLWSNDRVRRQIKEYGNLILLGSPICAATYANSERNGKKNSEIREWPDYDRASFDKAYEEVGEKVFLDPRFLALFASRRILPTEEVTFDYGFDF